MSLQQILNREVIALKKANNDVLSDQDKTRIENLQIVSKAIDSIGIDDSAEFDALIKDIHSLLDNGLISPLSLNDDEFDANNINYRCGSIIKTDSGIANLNAFKGIIKKTYNVNDLEETTEYNNREINYNTRIYLTAGGVMLGKYFELCYIRPSVISKHKFNVQKPIAIPVSAIYTVLDKDTTNFILTMDKREPKFTALKNFYDVPIYEDKDIEKIDIRKFKKIV